MDIKSTFFGTQSVDPDSIVTFPNGLPGFETDTRFKFFHQEGSDVVYWLQSLDTEELLFSVALPVHFNINYNFALTDEEEQLLQVENVEDLIVVILLQKNEQENGKPVIKGSIKSPLIINTAKRLGVQKILAEVEQMITLTETSSEMADA